MHSHSCTSMFKAVTVILIYEISYIIFVSCAMYQRRVQHVAGSRGCERLVADILQKVLLKKKIIKAVPWFSRGNLRLAGTN